MNRIRLILSVTAFLLAVGLGTGTVLLLRHANAAVAQDSSSDRITRESLITRTLNSTWS